MNAFIPAPEPLRAWCLHLSGGGVVLRYHVLVGWDGDRLVMVGYDADENDAPAGALLRTDRDDTQVVAVLPPGVLPSSIAVESALRRAREYMREDQWKEYVKPVIRALREGTCEFIPVLSGEEWTPGEDR